MLLTKTAAIAATALILLHGASAGAQLAPEPKPAGSSSTPEGQKSKSMRIPERIFVSGHSLTNEPIPSDLAAIAAGFGHKVWWNRQYLEGSSIKQRSRGDAEGASPWTGYAKGIDYKNAPIDVLAELRRPAHHPDQPYDTLLITEQHGVLSSLVWQDTPTHLRDFHDRFIALNPDGVTYFYESWLSLDSKADPRRWIAYERAAAPVWRCVVAQTNAALAAEGRRDRIISLPAALALAGLIERATQGGGVPGITRESVQATVGSIVEDQVHLTRLGNYYMALVTFAYMFPQSPRGAWHPAEVTPQQAAALQEIAASISAESLPPPMSIEDCRDYVRRSFMWTYLSYFGETFWRSEKGYLGSLYLRAKVAVQWWRLFGSDGPENPLSKAAYQKR